MGIGDLPIQNSLFNVVADTIHDYASNDWLPREPSIPDDDGEIRLPFSTLHTALTNQALTRSSLSLAMPYGIAHHLGVICQIAESTLFVLILASSGLWIRWRLDGRIQPIETDLGHAIQIACTDTRCYST